TNPLWLHPTHAAQLGIETGELVRVETEIGHFVLRAWVTEGIRPGIVACSHHMGRWKLKDAGQRQLMATVALEHEGSQWGLRRERGVAPYESSDADTLRIWWTDVGVHQNLTFPVHPDPVSGQHCWHQAVRVIKAQPTDNAGDIFVDTEKARKAFRNWHTAEPVESMLHLRSYNAVIVEQRLRFVVRAFGLQGHDVVREIAHGIFNPRRVDAERTAAFVVFDRTFIGQIVELHGDAFAV